MQIQAVGKRYFQRITSSIAFYPAVFSVVFILLAIALRRLDSMEINEAVKEALPSLLIENRDVSLSLLTVVIGGLIPLMVFSFSMVMLLLSNATANLSPRLLPSLVGSRRHQLVLGFYLGTILYCIIIAMGLGLEGSEDQPLGISITLAIFLCIGCLAVFITFIHGVSRSIQVEAVLEDVYERTLKSLQRVAKREAKWSSDEAPDFEKWAPLLTQTVGFFQAVDEEAVAAFAKTHDTAIAITAIRGAHVLKGDELGRVRRGNLSEKQCEALFALFTFTPTEHTDHYFVHGITRIVEVAVKALSPSTNDPGTAVTAIHYLKHLLSESLKIGDWECVEDKDEQPRFFLRVEAWENLLNRYFTSIFEYGKGDPHVVNHLGGLLDALEPRLVDMPSRRRAVAHCRQLLGNSTFDQA